MAVTPAAVAPATRGWRPGGRGADGARDVTRAALSLAAVVAVWALVTESGLANTDLFPSPAMVWSAAVGLYQEGLLLDDISVSVGRAAVGFVIGATAGVLLGLCTGRLPAVGQLFKPILNLLRPVPAIALAPVAIVWFGIGEASKYFVISYTVFLAVWLATDHGTSQVAQTYLRASRSLGAGTTREFFEVVIPAAAPHIVAGLRMGAALSFLALVAAELTGASEGIGYRIQESRQFIRTDRMFVGLILLGVLGALLDQVFLRLGRRLVHWEQA